MKRLLLALIFSSAAALCTTVAAQVTPNFSLVADYNTGVPGGTGTFVVFGQLLVDAHGRAAFIGYGSNGESGVYLYDQGNLSVIADENTLIPGSATDRFQRFFDIGLADGWVTFSAGYQGVDTGCAFNGAEGVFARRVNGGSLITVIDSPSYGNSCFHGVDFQQGLLATAGGTQAPDTLHNHSESVYITGSLGNLTPVLDSGTSHPGGGTFLGYDQSLILQSGDLYFAEIVMNTVGAVAGVYVDRNDGLGPQTLVDQTTQIPNGVGNFANIAGFDVSGDEIAFTGRDSNNRVLLFRGTGPTQLTQVVDVTTQVPGETTNFSGVSNPLAFSNDILLFSGYWAGGGNGLFAHNNGSFFSVLKKGDILHGLTVDQAFCWPQCLKGRFALVDVRYPNFTRGLYLMEF